MPRDTKTEIKKAFFNLLGTTLFDNITVKDIADECGINRNTFYYNFEDIYALTEEILQEETEKIVTAHKTHRTWNEGLSDASKFAKENRRAILNLHKSSKSYYLVKYFKKIIYNVVIEFVNLQAEGLNISENDKNFIAGFYTCALMGLLSEWLDSDMKGDFEPIIEKTGILFDNSIADALKTLAEK